MGTRGRVLMRRKLFGSAQSDPLHSHLQPQSFSINRNQCLKATWIGRIIVNAIHSSTCRQSASQMTISCE